MLKDVAAPVITIDVTATRALCCPNYHPLQMAELLARRGPAGVEIVDYH